MNRKRGRARRTASAAFDQKRAGRIPEVRLNTSGKTSMAMSQRTPSLGLIVAQALSPIGD
jgi:hypothetical protein